MNFSLVQAFLDCFHNEYSCWIELILPHNKLFFIFNVFKVAFHSAGKRYDSSLKGTEELGQNELVE